jgi:hypothetical protein
MRAALNDGEPMQKAVAAVPEKPDCADFIVAAIRAIRRKSNKLKVGTVGGIKIQKLFRIARDAYSAQEFREGLELLLKKRAIVIIGDVYNYRDGEAEEFFGTRQSISSIPGSIRFEEKEWSIDFKGAWIDSREVKDYQLFRRVSVYAVADGLPANVVRRCTGELADSPRTSLARQIIASMKW